jgi:LAO/AO transport system kinase
MDNKQNPSSFPKKKYRKMKNEEISINDYIKGILNKDRVMLAKAITLIESNLPEHKKKSQQILKELLPYTGNSVRIGISGVPGAGKSTFIESFGLHLIKQHHKVAVLAIDPTSSVNGGSILGDKTRMEQLVKEKNAFIRPSPSEGTLGGVHRKTRETIALCEAFGFDVIIVETVGVGQSEANVRGMVDFFLLLAITGAGDELQGMKRGIMELVDAIVVNKADGDNIRHAEKTKREFNQILHFLQPATKGWKTKAYTCSALYHQGMEEIWKVIQQFIKTTKTSGVFYERRKEQRKDWVHALIQEKLLMDFYQDSNVKSIYPSLIQQVVEGQMPATEAVESLFQAFYQK